MGSGPASDLGTDGIRTGLCNNLNLKITGDAGDLLLSCLSRNTPELLGLHPDLAARGLRRSLSATGMSHWWC